MHITITSAGHLHEIQTRHILKRNCKTLCRFAVLGPVSRKSRQLFGTEKPFSVCSVCIQDQSFNNSENGTMKLQRLITEAKLTRL